MSQRAAISGARARSGGRHREVPSEVTAFLAFRPTIVSAGRTAFHWVLVRRDRHPVFSRAIRDIYPEGST